MRMLLFAQADIAPLMASLIGVPFPLNSVVGTTNVLTYCSNVLALEGGMLGLRPMEKD